MGLLAVTMTFLMSACQQAKPIKAKPTQSLPDWFVSPPKDSAKLLFGVGEGKTKDEAVEFALSNLAGKLGTEIQANSKLTKTQYSSAYRFNDEVNQHTVESTIRKITLNQYKVVESKNLGYQKFIAMVSSNKLLLRKSLQQALDKQIADYETAKITLSNKVGFSRFQFFAKQQQKLEEFNNNLSALLTLRISSNVKTYQNYLHDVQSSFIKSKQQTVFYISSQTTAEHVKKTITDRLLQDGLKTTHKADEASNLIEIKTDLKPTKTYGFFILRESIELKTSEANERLGGNQFAIKGQGLNLQQAQQQLGLKLKQQLQQSSIQTILGINQE